MIIKYVEMLSKDIFSSVVFDIISTVEKSGIKEAYHSEFVFIFTQLEPWASLPTVIWLLH